MMTEILLLLILIVSVLKYISSIANSYALQREVKAIDDKLNVIMKKNLKERIEQNKKKWKK